LDKVVHFEIPIDEFARAQKFYRSIFGWNVSEVPGMEYFMVHTVEVDEKHMPKESGSINGGMMKRHLPGEYPRIVVNVNSVDDALEKIQKAGEKWSFLSRRWVTLVTMLDSPIQKVTSSASGRISSNVKN
jgi:hypothetical protein